jgi:hypothetical protein
MRGSLRCGGKCAAFGRDDGFWGGAGENKQLQLQLQLCYQPHLRYQPQIRYIDAALNRA